MGERKTAMHRDGHAAAARRRRTSRRDASAPRRLHALRNSARSCETLPHRKRNAGVSPAGPVASAAALSRCVPYKQKGRRVSAAAFNINLFLNRLRANAGRDRERFGHGHDAADDRGGRALADAVLGEGRPDLAVVGRGGGQDAVAHLLEVRGRRG